MKEKNRYSMFFQKKSIKNWLKLTENERSIVSTGELLLRRVFILFQFTEFDGIMQWCISIKFIQCLFFLTRFFFLLCTSLELVVLMKFFCLRIFLPSYLNFTFVCIFPLICIDWFDARKKFRSFLSHRTQIKQFYFHSFLFCNQNDKRNLKSKLISWNCLIQCRLWCKYPHSFFYEFVDFLLSIDFSILKHFFWFCSTFFSLLFL